MAGEKLDGINPTRMELLNLKDRAKLSTKGHSLLKEKRDALIKEFFEILDRVQGSRDEVEKKLAIAYAELNKAQIDMGDMAVKRAALSVRESIELDISSRSIMGVSVPVVKSKSTHNDVISRGYEELKTETGFALFLKAIADLFPCTQVLFIVTSCFMFFSF